MLQRTVSDEELEALRIFPLPEIVLFPNTVVPLRVFEPRYRLLVEHCLEEGLPLAIWQIDPVAPPTAHGPGIRDVATAGRIAIHHRLPDGRFNIVVEGLERVRLLEELGSATDYRIVRSRRHPLDEPEPGEVARRIETIRGIAWLLAHGHPRASRLVRVTLDRLTCRRELSDVLCSVTFDDAAVRQVLLQTSSVTARLDKVVDSLAGLVLTDGEARTSEEEEGRPILS